jgi:hypothetical protein
MQQESEIPRLIFFIVTLGAFKIMDAEGRRNARVTLCRHRAINVAVAVAGFKAFRARMH